MEQEKKDMNIIFDNEHVEIGLQDGILILIWKKSFIDLSTAKEAVSNRLSVTAGQNYPALIKIKSIKESTKEARDFLASEKGCENIIAGAIYVESLLENMLASFFIYLNKPVIPTKIFKDEIKAKEWLAQFVVRE